MDKKLTALCAAFCAYSAFGSGFQILEQGAGNLGSALAGATANATGDASCAFWNPSASLFNDMKEGGIMVDSAATFVIPSFEFNNKNSSPNLGNKDGGNAGELACVPNAYIVYRLLEDVAVTFSMTSTYGLETDYDEGWVGRYYALNSNLTNIDFNPSIAYKPNDWFSISAGFSMQWMHARLSQAVPIIIGSQYRGDGIVDLSGDSWAAGANAGFTIKYADEGRFAFSWRSEVAQTLKGNQHLNGVVTNPIDCDLTLPQTFNVGFYQRLWGDLHRFAIMADYAFTGWSCFENLDIKNSNTGQTVGGKPVYENWKNTSRVAVGFNYHPAFSDNVVFRWGTAWDESPIRSPDYRTARIPCADRIWLSTGVSYFYENMHIDIGYTYILFYNDSQIHTDGGATNTLDGEYTGHAHVVSIQAGIRW